MQPVVQPVVGCTMTVVQPVVQPLGQPVASCKQTFNRLFNRLFNRFNNRLYRVNGVLISRVFLALIVFYKVEALSCLTKVAYISPMRMRWEINTAQRGATRNDNGSVHFTAVAIIPLYRTVAYDVVTRLVGITNRADFNSSEQLSC